MICRVRSAHHLWRAMPAQHYFSLLLAHFSVNHSIMVIDKLLGKFVSIVLGDLVRVQYDDPKIKHHMVIGAYDDDVISDIEAIVATAQRSDVVSLGIPPAVRQLDCDAAKLTLPLI